MAKQTYSLTLDEFRGLATEGNLIPLYREILADFETPVSAFAKIDQGPTAYLLESVAGGENWARYSFLGSGSSAVLHEEKGDLILTRGKKRLKIQSRGNPLERVRELMEEYRPVTVPGLPRFVGGAVGYLSYDVVRTFEELPSLRRDSLGMPELAFLLTDTLLIFDNVSQKIKIVANAYLESTTDRAIREAYRHATARIEKMIARLKRPMRQPRVKRRRKPITFTPNMNRADFEKMVTRTKEYIRAGDIVQAVLSQRWETQIHTTPFQLYRALRVVNPSPYMYYLRVAGVELVGSSPETLVRCEDGAISLRPIAGTRRRGKTPDEDQDLARALLADEKERAEHVMLVDLGAEASAGAEVLGRLEAHEDAGPAGQKRLPWVVLAVNEATAETSLQRGASGAMGRVASGPGLRAALHAAYRGVVALSPEFMKRAPRGSGEARAEGGEAPASPRAQPPASKEIRAVPAIVRVCAALIEAASSSRSGAAGARPAHPG